MQTTTVSVETTIIFCRQFNVFSKSNQVKIVVWKLYIWKSHFFECCSGLQEKHLERKGWLSPYYRITTGSYTGFISNEIKPNACYAVSLSNKYWPGQHWKGAFLLEYDKSEHSVLTSENWESESTRAAFIEVWSIIELRYWKSSSVNVIDRRPTPIFCELFNRTIPIRSRGICIKCFRDV